MELWIPPGCFAMHAATVSDSCGGMWEIHFLPARIRQFSYTETFARKYFITDYSCEWLSNVSRRPCTEAQADKLRCSYCQEVKRILRVSLMKVNSPRPRRSFFRILGRSLKPRELIQGFHARRHGPADTPLRMG